GGLFVRNDSTKIRGSPRRQIKKNGALPARMRYLAREPNIFEGIAAMSEDHPNRPPLPKMSPRLLRRLCRGRIDPAPAVNADDPSYLRLGFVIAVLGMAGISYWVVQERSQSTALTKSVAEAPAPAMQRRAQNPSESSVPDAGVSPAAIE